LERAAAVVSNVDVPTTNVRLLGRPAPAVAMTPSVITFYWGLREAPRGLGHHTIFLPEHFRRAFDDLMHRGRIPADMPFYVALPSSTDGSLAPEGKATMFVLVPTPVLSRLGGVDWSETVADVKSRVLRRLRSHGADVAASIESETVMTPEDWRRRFGLWDGSAFGAAHTLSQVGSARSGRATTLAILKACTTWVRVQHPARACRWLS
jgi:phytoene dehydrogenase-like protein